MLSDLLTLVSQHFQYDLSAYKSNFIERRIQARLHDLGLNKIEEYLPYIRANENELQHFQKGSLIGVTAFFRDPEAFHALKKDIIPTLLRNTCFGDVLRIWVPACSSGEEVYTIAMLIQECMHEMDHYPAVKIFATDFNEDAIKKASAGIYSTDIEISVNSKRLEQFFIKKQATYTVKKQIRNMVIFSKQNLINDPPFTKIDLISCRNLIIYFNGTLQNKIISVFNYCLKNEGILFLGSSESILGQSNLFKTLSHKWKIYQKNERTSYLEAALNFPTRYRTFA